MKITDVRSFVVDCFRTNFVFVKIYTDEGVNGMFKALAADLGKYGIRSS